MVSACGLGVCSYVDLHADLMGSRRRGVLPLISKRWTRLLRGPSHAWRAISFDKYYDLTQEDAEPALNAATIIAWFTSRPG